MATIEKHIVRFWRGSRASYNFLKKNKSLDPWIRYTVIEPDSTMTEYFGYNPISLPSGQLLPVNSIVTVEPESASPYTRLLVGKDGEGYRVVEYTPTKDDDIVKSEIEFDWKYGVRVLSESLKCYIYVDGKLRTYDDVDCGEY